MPKSQTTPLHASKTKITCRICGPDQPQILRQCYKHHLKTAHNDVTGNLREWGQASLAGFSKGEKSTTTHNEEIDGSKRSCPETLVNNISCEDVSGDIEMTETGEENSLSGESLGENGNCEMASDAGRSADGDQGLRRSFVSSQKSSGIIQAEVGSQESDKRKRSPSPCERSSVDSSKERSEKRINGDKTSYKSSSESECEGSSGEQSKVQSLEKKLKDYAAKNRWVMGVMGNILAKVDRMLEKVGAKADVRDCNNNGYIELSKKINVLENFINVSEEVKKLEKVVETFKTSTSTAVKEAPTDDKIMEEDIVEALRECTSVEDIEGKFHELKYNSEDEKFWCRLCKKSSSGYAADLESDFSGKVMSEEFRNLKKSLKKHLLGTGHREAVQNEEETNKPNEKHIGREKRIGKALGHVAYYLLKNGRPNSDFPLLINILAAAGVDVGDLNHSRKFVAHWGPVCAEVIENKLKTYFRTPLVQTGRLPPVKGVADKATWQHNTRMLSGLVTVVPDSQTLLQAFLTGTEVCPGGSGDLMCASLVKTWQPYIKGSQYNGLAADGATLHCNVGSKLADHFKRKGHDDYDPLHKAGLVDVHMRAPGAGENFKFLQEINEVISNLNSFFNMGMEHHRFLEIVKELAEGGIDIKGKVPRFFSDTRFANYSSLVYAGFIENFPAMIRAITQVQEEGYAQGASDNQKKKADKCAGIQVCLQFLFWRQNGVHQKYNTKNSCT